jgi:hypothetical protein
LTLLKALDTAIPFICAAEAMIKLSETSFKENLSTNKIRNFMSDSNETHK